ncbi:DNA-binding protein [Brucella pseudogrignonensis]|uniref:DNA-binding protein n=1 Tax=Brucella pseudogrignonensis TaxID=419475 RepID=A0A7Y3T2I6_9HYPH|nr:helix-turn-helix domain-containing protein [Brucella pseudogrignonensis]MCM0752927.1 DNA-binding protein [Brucella pseudogrignonensis]NNV19523.1 DNA-binding protein [Brucella pseudogrignonensis]
MSQTANTIQPRAYGITDAAKYLSVHRSTIYRLAHNGELKIKKIAGRAVVLREDLDKFLDNLPAAVG